MLGGVIFTLMFFKHPFVESSKLGIINASFMWPPNSQYSSKLENLVRNLLTPNPDQRISSAEVADLLENWHQLTEVKLNSMAKEILNEHQIRFGRKKTTNRVLKKRKSVNERESNDEFDFSGLNKLSKKKKSPKTNFFEGFTFNSVP